MWKLILVTVVIPNIVYKIAILFHKQADISGANKNNKNAEKRKSSILPFGSLRALSNIERSPGQVQS